MVGTIMEDLSLDDMPFLGNRDQSAKGADLYQKTFEGFADRFGSELSQDQLRILKLFGESYGLSGGWTTQLHSYRLWLMSAMMIHQINF